MPVLVTEFQNSAAVSKAVVQLKSLIHWVDQEDRRFFEEMGLATLGL